MHPPFLIISLSSSFLAIQSSSKTKTGVSSSLSKTFWNDSDQVFRKCQHDPPPPSTLKQIQEEPWRGGLEPLPTVGISYHDVEIVEGTIPSDLNGMLCRNGPGRIRIGETQYGHWFDGDGFISQLLIDGTTQTAFFQAKYVETDRFNAQQQLMMKQQTSSSSSLGKVPLAKSGAWTKRGSNGSRLENLFTIPTNPANTNVIFFPKRKSFSGSSSSSSNNNKDNKDYNPELYAIAEGGDPVLMDSRTLETIGPKKITSGPKSSERLTSNSFFSAHYTRDPTTNEIYNHGLQLSLGTAVNVMKLNPNGDLMQQASTELSSLCFIHDNALSENYFVLVVPPYSASQQGFFDSLLGGEPLGKQFRWNDQNETKTMALVFSKDTLACIARVPLPLLSTYHLVDAFESENEVTSKQRILTIRLLVHGPPPSERILVENCFSDLYRAGPLPLCTIMEYTVDLISATLHSSRPVAPDSRPCELPVVNDSWGYKKRYLYTNTREDHVAFTNSIQKVDMDTGKCSEVISFGDGVYCGGPTFVPKPNSVEEDDGYIFVYLYRSMEHGSDVCILDAKTMKKLSLLRLQSPVPYQFHGAWYTGA
jgi:carotenoid cleavage dioxygenase-like enzyme